MSSDTSPYLVVGLGNPGEEYEQTRHNLGFAVVDELARRLGTPKFGIKYKGHFQEIRLSDRKLLLLKPQTYMNVSGESVLPAVGFYKIDPAQDLIVITDDLDLPPGQLRLRKSGSPGGHNGLRSIVELLGTESFARLRVGIGRSEKIPSDKFVLMKVSSADRPVLEDAVKRAADAVETILKDGFTKAMDLFNRSITQTKENGSP